MPACRFFRTNGNTAGRGGGAHTQAGGVVRTQAPPSPQRAHLYSPPRGPPTSPSAPPNSFPLSPLSLPGPRVAAPGPANPPTFPPFRFGVTFRLAGLERMDTGASWASSYAFYAGSWWWISAQPFREVPEGGVTVGSGARRSLGLFLHRRRIAEGDPELALERAKCGVSMYTDPRPRVFARYQLIVVGGCQSIKLGTLGEDAEPVELREGGWGWRHAMDLGDLPSFLTDDGTLKVTAAVQVVT